MSQKFRAALAVAAALAAFAAIAPSSFGVTQISDSPDTLADYFYADEAMNDGSFFAEEPLDPGATGPSGAPTTGYADEPILGWSPGTNSKSITLSSGYAEDLWRTTPLSGQWSDVVADAHAGLHDVSSIRFFFKLPADKQCVRFDYRVLTNETPTESFYEGLLAQIDATDFSFDSGTKVMTAPGNIATIGGGPALVTPIKNLFEPPSATSGYLRKTPVQTATSALLAPGAHTLQVSVFDQGDNEVDTGAQLANFRAASGADCGIVPISAPVPSNAFTLGKFSSSKGVGKLGLTLSSPGSVTVYDSNGPKVSVTRAGAAKAKKKVALIKKVVLTAPNAGILSIKIKPTSAGKKKLSATGKLKVKLAIVFKANGNPLLTTQFKTVTIKKKKKS
jgi:hypothetical protein